MFLLIVAFSGQCGLEAKSACKKCEETFSLQGKCYGVLVV